MPEEPAPAAGIEELRPRPDRVDEQFPDRLRERIKICVHITHHKRVNDIPVMQPQRIGVVQERAARFGSVHGIDQKFLRELYDLVIAETCRVEDLVIGGSAA